MRQATHQAPSLRVRGTARRTPPITWAAPLSETHTPAFPRKSGTIRWYIRGVTKCAAPVPIINADSQ